MNNLPTPSEKMQLLEEGKSFSEIIANKINGEIVWLSNEQIDKKILDDLAYLDQEFKNSPAWLTMIKLFIGELRVYLNDGIATKEEISIAWSKAADEYKSSYELFSSEQAKIKDQTKKSLKN